jgi:hypothetical protein
MTRQTKRRRRTTMEINSKTWKVLADEMEAALGEVIDRHGLEVGKVSGSYGRTTGTFRFEVTQTAAASTDGKTQAQREYERSADLFDLKPEWFGQAVMYQGHQVTITGLAMKSRKFPVLGTDDRGRKMKYTTQVIRQAFKNEGWDVQPSWHDNVVPRPEAAAIGLTEEHKPDVYTYTTAPHGSGFLITPFLKTLDVSIDAAVEKEANNQ